MIIVGVHEAKTTLSKLLVRAVAGEQIVIARDGEPVARLVPVERPGQRELGQDVGLVQYPEDFNEPLTAELLGAFEGDKT